jgi:hypothetical protein
MNRRPQVFQYLTIDQVNGAAAKVMAEQHGVALELAEPRDMPRLEDEGALVILDWDFLPPEHRSRVLESQALRVVAVHSYGLSDSIAGFLSRRGILYFKRLGPEVFAGIKGLAPAA